MKTKKVILKYVVMPLVILLVVLAVVFFFVGAALIKTAVTKAASSTLGVPVTIKDLDISILRGRVGARHDDRGKALRRGDRLLT